MKIGILTMPLKTNYGGLLQAYALQNTLMTLGHNPIIISREYPSKKKFIDFILFYFVLLRNKILTRPFPILTKKEQEVVSSNFNCFIKKHINRSKFIYTHRQFLKHIENEKYQAYVVGSDQVWRPMYCPNLLEYYFEFANTKSVRRVAYAASFGVDNWEYTKEQTQKCKSLIKYFNGISVREDTAIDLCKENFGVDVSFVLDPTMLLDKEEYIKLSTEGQSGPIKGDMFCYLLDNSIEKQELVENIKQITNYIAFTCMPSMELVRGKIFSNKEKCVFPSPSQWIRSFNESKLVVTDSFHGTVFSIIFNKPFIVLANKRRGNTRMESLLRLFHLEDRMVSNIDQVLLLKPICWTSVNTILHDHKEKSIDFLKTSLEF